MKQDESDNPHHRMVDRPSYSSTLAACTEYATHCGADSPESHRGWKEEKKSCASDSLSSCMHKWMQKGASLSRASDSAPDLRNMSLSLSFFHFDFRRPLGALGPLSFLNTVVCAPVRPRFRAKAEPSPRILLHIIVSIRK